MAQVTEEPERLEKGAQKPKSCPPPNAAGSVLQGAAATNSGGRIFEAEAMGDLDKAFKGVADELRQQYAVGYYPDDTGKPGDRKKIKIEVARPPKAVIRAKTNYIVKERDDEPGPSSSGVQGK